MQNGAYPEKTMGIGGCRHSCIGDPQIIHVHGGFSSVNHPFLGYPPFQETPIPATRWEAPAQVQLAGLVHVASTRGTASDMAVHVH